MKRLLASTVLIMALSALAGCAFMSDEDRDFYGRGWVKPTELDQQYPHHSGAPAGSAYDPASGTASTTSDPAHDGAWDVPPAQPQ